MGTNSTFKKYILPLMLTAIVMLMVACTGDNNANNVTNPNPNPFQPKGTVSGVLRDAVTQNPLAGAVVHIMDRAATTDATGIFTITNVPALTGTGNEAGAGTAVGYPVVIDMAAVNARITTGAKYASIVYNVATPVYTSLGDAALVGAGATSTNHDTPVDGFVANIMPTAGRLDAAIKMQVVDTKLNPVAGATVTIFTAAASNNNQSGATGTPGHLVDTKTTDATGFVTFSGLEAKQSFVVKAVTSDSTKEGWYGNYAVAGGGVTPAGQGAASIIVAPTDNLTDVYAVQGGAAYDSTLGAFFSNALVIGTVDGVAPFLLSSTPSNLADIAAPTTGTLDFAFNFSEPIQSSNYSNALTRDASINGGLYADVAVNYNGPKAGNIPHTLAWNTARTTLTISIPAASVTAQSRYSVSIAGALAVGKLKDNNGNSFAAVPATATIAITTSGGFNVAAPVASKTNANNSLAIEWPTVANAASYNVYWSIVNKTPYRSLLNRAAVVGDNGTIVVGGITYGGVFNVAGFPTFNLTAIPGFSLTSGQTYAVKVVAVNGQGSESEFSNELTFSETAPAAVTNIAKTALATDVTSYTYTWTASANAVSYNVYVEPVVGGTGMGYDPTPVNTTVPTVDLTAKVAAVTAAAVAPIGPFTTQFNKGQQAITWNVKVTAVAPFGSESAPAVAGTGIVDQTRAAIAAVAQTTVATGVAVRPVALAVAGTVGGAAVTGTGTLTVTFSKTMNYTDLNTLANWTMSAPAGSTGTTFSVTSVTPNANGLSAVIGYSYSIAPAVAPAPANNLVAGNATVTFSGKSVTTLAVNNNPF